MKHGIMILVLTLMVLGSAHAVVNVIVDDSGTPVAYEEGVGGVFIGSSALVDAVAAVNLDPTTDEIVIEIQSSATFVGDVIVQHNDVTIQAAAGETPTIQADGNNGLGYGLELAVGSFGTGFTLVGAAPTSLLTVTSNDYCTGTAQGDSVWTNLHMITNGTVLETDQVHLDASAPGPKTSSFNYCTFTAQVRQEFGPNTVFNNCTFDVSGDYQVGLTVFFNNATFSNCYLAADGTFPPVLNYSATETLFVGCEFVGNGNTSVMAQNNAYQTSTFNDCSFTGFERVFVAPDCAGTINAATMTFPGTNGFYGFLLFTDSAAGPLTLNILHTDFTGIATGAVMSQRAGVVNLEDCVVEELPIFMDGDIVAGGAHLNLDRCLVRHPGAISNGALAGSQGGVVISATNSIFDMNGRSEALLATWANDVNSFDDQINLVHCTFYGAATVDTAPFIATDGGDTIEAYYNVFDAASAGAVAYASATGSNNLINPGGIADGGFTGGNPLETVWGDPVLDATGHLADWINSPALGAAFGSLVDIDFDGEVRPQGASLYPDLGADEVAEENYSSSVDDWALYQ